MNDRHKKKRADSPEPTAVIRELMAQPGIKKIRVFKNGDAYHQGVQMVINDRQVQDLDIFLTAVTRRIELPFGAKKLYSTNGTQVKDIRQIKDGKDYVASSGLFTPQAYGGQKHRAKSVEPEKKKKRKKKRAVSVAPTKDVESHKETKKLVEGRKEIVMVPLNHPKKKKIKKEKKKVEESETRPVTRHDIHYHEEKRDPGSGDVRSVSRYGSRPPTRAESRTHWKDESIDDDDTKSAEEHHDGSFSEAESEKEGILPSEIHIPFNNKLHIEDKRDSIVSRGHDLHHEVVEEKDKIVGQAKDVKKAAKTAADKRKNSVYHWGDLNSFTKNIESLLKRKE